MREIKFRAWHEGLNNYKYMSIESFNFGSFRGLIDNSVENDTAIWEQYTGLKDKNGKEIYEGDILKTRKGTIQEVVSLIGNFDGNNMTSQFTCFCAGWQNVNPSDVKGWYFSKTDEVIGNIHENADLLEEK